MAWGETKSIPGPRGAGWRGGVSGIVLPAGRDEGGDAEDFISPHDEGARRSQQVAAGPGDHVLLGLQAPVDAIEVRGDQVAGQVPAAPGALGAGADGAAKAERGAAGVE
jgi:hypothetical protein